jgi:hypothetical protein
MPKKPSMEEKNKNDREKDYINMFLEQSLMQQREEMMKNFSHILQCLSITTDTYSSNGPLWRHLSFQGTS